MKNILYLPLVLMLLLASCSREDVSSEVEIGGQPVQLSSSIAQASNSGWDADRSIGVFMLSSGTSLTASSLADNARLSTANGVDFSFTSPIYYPANGAAVDFVAYAPYRATPVSSPYTYKVDVSNQTNQDAIDLLYSTNATGKSRSTAPVDLEFNHMLSKIVVNVFPGLGYSAADLAGMEVRLEGMPTKADFDISTGTLSTPSTIADIVAVEVAPSEINSYSFEAIVIPQEDNTWKWRKIVISFPFTEYIYNVFLFESYEPGYSYTYYLPIHGVEVGRYLKVEQWVTNSERAIDARMAAIGDYFYSDGSYSAELSSTKECIGVVCREKTLTQSGLVLSIDELNNTMWSSEQLETGANDENNGANNMEKIKAIPGWQAKYPAFAWCDAKNDPVTGKPGWYIPAKNEIIPIADFKYLLNVRLYKLAGGPYISSYWWSSSEDSADKAWSVSLNNSSYVVSGNKNTSYLNARAVFAF